MKERSSILNVVVVAARCGADRSGMGLRYEENARAQWICDWAFAIEEKSARREGYDKIEISGEILFADEFPGCPHCGSRNFVKCQCEKMSCMREGTKDFTCAWCGISGTVDGVVTNLSAGNDR